MKPFRMVAIGDSIMWGQGLRDDQKFTTLVKDALEMRTKRQIARVEGSCHSGATMGPGESGPRDHGELPADRPSIPDQSRSVPDPAGVDLVLVNGGINDLGGHSVLMNPGANVTTFSTVAEQACGVRMRELLSDILVRYSRAKVVVLGYYMIITSHSNLADVAHLLRVTSRIVAVPGLDWPAWILMDLLTPPALLGYREAMAPRHKLWRDVSRTHLRHAVEAQTSDRVIFIDPQFSEANAYGAEDTFLWRTNDDDPMLGVRREMCGALAVGCLRAATAHPNEAGARRYADKIMEGIDRAGWPRLWGEPLRMHIQTTPEEVTIGESTRVVVSLADSVTGGSVEGRIRVDDDLTDHPAGTEFKYIFRNKEHTVTGFATKAEWNDQLVRRRIKARLPRLHVQVIKPTEPIRLFQRTTVKLLVQDKGGVEVPARLQIDNGNMGGLAGPALLPEPPEGFDTTQEFEYVFRPYRVIVPRRNNPEDPDPGPQEAEQQRPTGTVRAPGFEDATVEFRFAIR